jgi:hypothetical protein
MTGRARCPICSKHKPERYCPAKGEQICAVCCGTWREVTLDCPPDCTYLVNAHRHEREHRKPLTEDQIPFPTIAFSPNLVYEQQPAIVGLIQTILNFAVEHPELADGDVLAATMALGESYRTLLSGIYYQKLPDSLLASGLYTALEEFLRSAKQQETQQAGTSTLRDEQIFHLLVFLARLNVTHTNLRPRARIFLEFLRAQLPPELARPAETSRIIIP